jgi:predicted dehydrogenase/threonine dehydrogenase-like Zn-dependent dehydrogenase
MKQVLLRGGRATVEEVPAPQPRPGEILVRVAWSCLSPGTELANAWNTTTGGLLEDIRRNPAKIRKALSILQTSGLRKFSAIARERLNGSSTTGYSCAGTVLETGSSVEGFAPGDRVACAGDQYAKHAEFVAVPVNLTVPVPNGVEMADAATVTLGAIAMQGVRRAQVALGERIGVIGLGFLGQLTVQILKAAGCKVFGADLDLARVAQAKTWGLDAAPDRGDDIINSAQRFSEGYGLDAVLLTAATKSSEPLSLAMRMARRKGRVVVVGDVGLTVQRDLMYAKELDLLISTSYGPGRYDPTYEEEGLDYPYAYVRWTENRNMRTYLELIASGRINLSDLIDRRMSVSQAEEAYRVLKEENPRPYTVLLEYPNSTEAGVTRQITLKPPLPVKAGRLRLAILGAGSFARGVHVPNLQQLSDRFHIEAIVTRHGPSALALARQVGARIAATDYKEVLADPAIDAVLIATRHHLHAKMVDNALRAGKHVFVEKPLAINEEELHQLIITVDELNHSPGGCPVTFVGFNRRHSPYAVKLREAVVKCSGPIQLMYRMNVDYFPPGHWAHGAEGGGRILGEACHIFDLFGFLTDSPAVEVLATGVHSNHRDVLDTDNFTATIRYADGSVCTLLYTAGGGKGLSKEVLEMHVDGQSFVLDDYRALTSFGAQLNLKTKKQEKGHQEELIAFHKTICGSLDQGRIWTAAVEVSRTTFEVDQKVRGKGGADIPESR